MNLQTVIFNSKQVALGFIGKPPLLCHSRKTRSSYCMRGCNPGDYFECLRCKRLMPFCMGAGDVFEDWCDNCVADYEKLEGFPKYSDLI